jgi:hypothetical protein
MATGNMSRNAYIHTYGVAQACALIAGRRGLNTEIAYISGLVHDLYTYKTGIIINHQHNGAEMARPALRDMNIFSADEQKLILSAVFHHGDKVHVHDDYDEVLKDADVLSPFLNDAGTHMFYYAVPRLSRLLKEFNFDVTPPVCGYENNDPLVIQNRRLIFADIAGKLAAKRIHGEKDDNDFTEIIKYFPESSAFDELKNGWCAAFVYHVCFTAGLKLPIRPPLTSCRLAGVGAWYEWGRYNNFCFYEKDGFVPSAGDIVIYNNIIPAGKKHENSPWHDHIGIVLECNGDELIAAEGNADNGNISGIMTRKRDSTVGCYVRIPDDYFYDGWKYDYKTGQIRIADYTSIQDRRNDHAES